ncbi:hypothetical protein RJ641_027872 [Dillenia turbinata]|uniref:Uncharacterized protein n=1 Tax=Dillenia turbinata TaxID=194707 RepID=A0AAN8ZQV1_9MAGN
MDQSWPLRPKCGRNFSNLWIPNGSCLGFFHTKPIAISVREGKMGVCDGTLIGSRRRSESGGGGGGFRAGREMLRI